MSKSLRINMVGNFTSNMIGEIADETHLVRELRALGHEVRECPRDIWKAAVDGHSNPDWEGRLPESADINIICKWHHFSSEEYINKLRTHTGAPVVYWTWDYMDYDLGWHTRMAQASDLFLTNEGGRIAEIESWGIKVQYFPFDVSDGQFNKLVGVKKEYDVVFFGSCFDKGDRKQFITEINKQVKVKVFGHNWQGWRELGIDASPAVFGQDYVREVARAKIILGMNVNDHCWGYWSNRIGKVLTLGGFLLQRFVPGMELVIGDGAEYFDTPEEAIEKINYYLKNENKREEIANKGYTIGRAHFTSEVRMKQLSLLLERYLVGER